MLFSTVISACSDKPTVDERATLIADAENRVVLPEGSGSLACYKRVYSIVDVPNSYFGKRYLVGEYHLATPYMGEAPGEYEPGVSWQEREDLTMGFLDQGCRTLWFQYAIDDIDRSVQAVCAPTIDGSIPAKVDPPVDC